MSGVKASVLIPVYNGAPFIKEAVESILNQSFTDFELILLNDASPDNSEEILKLLKMHVFAIIVMKRTLAFRPAVINL